MGNLYHVTIVVQVVEHDQGGVPTGLLQYWVFIFAPFLKVLCPLVD